MSKNLLISESKEKKPVENKLFSTQNCFSLSYITFLCIVYARNLVIDCNMSDRCYLLWYSFHIFTNYCYTLFYVCSFKSLSYAKFYKVITGREYYSSRPNIYHKFNTLVSLLFRLLLFHGFGHCHISFTVRGLHSTPLHLQGRPLSHSAKAT